MTTSTPLVMPVPIQKLNYGSGLQRVSDSRFHPSFDDLPSSPADDGQSHWSGSPRSDAERLSSSAPSRPVPSSAPASTSAFSPAGTALSHPVTINYGQYQHATSQVRSSDTHDSGYSSPRHPSWRSSYLAHPKDANAYRPHPSGMSFVSAPVKGWSDLRAPLASPMTRHPQTAASFSPSSIDSINSVTSVGNDYYVSASVPDALPHPGLVSSTEQLPMHDLSTQQPPQGFYHHQSIGYGSFGSQYSRDMPQTPPSATYPSVPNPPNSFSAPYPQPSQWQGEQELFAVDESGEFSDEKGKDDKRRTVRRHICPVCDKRFNRPSSLNTHMSVHTGAKPYQCPKVECARRFSVSSNLRRHMRTHDSRLKDKEREERGPQLSPADISSSDEGHQIQHYVPPHMQSAYPPQYAFSASYPPPAASHPTPQLYTPTPAFADMHLSSDVRSDTNYQLSKTPTNPKAIEAYTPKTPQTSNAKPAQDASFYSPITFTRQ